MYSFFLICSVSHILTQKPTILLLDKNHNLFQPKVAPRDASSNMHLRCIPRVFNLLPHQHDLTPRESKAFITHDIYLPSSRSLSTARIARSGQSPPIPAVESLHFSAVINSTHSYLTFLSPVLSLSISPFIRFSHLLFSSRARQSLPKLAPGTGKSPRFGFRIRILTQESKAPRAGAAAELVRAFFPYFFLWSICCHSSCKDHRPVSIRWNSCNSNRIPFPPSSFALISWKYFGFLCSPPLILPVFISRKSCEYSMLLAP